MEVDPKVEIKWLEKRLEDVQKGVLKAKNVDLPEAERIVVRIKEAIEQDSKAIEEMRVALIRLQAMKEEQLKGKVEKESEKEAEKKAEVEKNAAVGG